MTIVIKSLSMCQLGKPTIIRYATATVRNMYMQDSHV